MKRTLTALALLPLLFAAPGTAAAADHRVGLIDLKTVFDSYWKTKQADTRLKGDASNYDSQRKDLVDDFQKATADYKQLLEAANNQALSAEERQRRKTAAEQKLLELRQIEQDITLFDRNARSDLGKQQLQMRDKILEEIRKVITEEALAAGYTLVFDTAADSANQTPIILFHNGQNDLTQAVLTKLNSTAPISLLPSATNPDNRSR